MVHLMDLVFVIICSLILYNVKLSISFPTGSASSSKELNESRHRIVAVILSRQEFLERELFPIEYVNPENRRTRWWIIFKTPGPPRDEFIEVVENVYRQYSEWQSASLDDILSDFIDVMFTIYPDLSEGKKGPHNECDQDILEAIEINNDVRPKLFKILGIQYTNKNIAALSAISKRLSMRGSKNTIPAMSDPDDLRCIRGSFPRRK